MKLADYKRIFKSYGYNLLFKLDKGDSIKCYYALKRVDDREKDTIFQQTDLKNIKTELRKLLNKM